MITYAARLDRIMNQESRPHLILLPGLLCDHALWEPQIAGLSGMCASWVADLTRDDSIAAMAARVLAEAPAQKFALAGLSMGGYVAMEIMRQAPERVVRLALLDTRATLDIPEETVRRHDLMRLAQTEQGFTPVTSRLLPLLIHPARVKDGPLVRVIREMAERVGVEAYLRNQQAIMSRPDFRSELRRISCPTLVLCGREDALTRLEMHEEMARLIPTARLVIIEQCGHLSTLERPTEVNTALCNWLTPDPLRML
jgi:pimeloyl-ACP methyl ester carboxylesterase